MTPSLLDLAPAETPDPTTIPGLKFYTPRDPSRRTVGRLQEHFSRTWLGSGFMPSQRFIADVSGEVNEDGTPAHKLVIGTMQRQAGKSHLTMAQTAERCFSVAGFRAWYTAQTGQDSADQFLKFQDDVIAGRPLERVVNTLRGNGHQVMKFPNRSQLRPHPPTEEALHGKQSDRNDIDEAWAFSTEEGKAIMQAIGPTQLTRPASQTFIWSAGGTANSTWLAELVARGRAGEPGICYFEFGVPDDLDISDLEAVAAYHPAIGHTMTVESLRALRTILPDDDEFARAAGNRWTSIIGSAIDTEQWGAARWADPIPDRVSLGYGAARAADGSHVAIAAAAQVDEFVVCEVIDIVATFGAAEAVRTICTEGDVAVDPSGPSANLYLALERDGAPLVDMGGRSAQAAVANVLDGLKDGHYKFRMHPDLDAAVRVAGTRNVGDGGKAWARLTADAPIATLEAVTLAAYAATQQNSGEVVSRW